MELTSTLPAALHEVMRARNPSVASEDDEHRRAPNDRTDLALALTAGKVAIETTQAWGLNRGRTANRFLHFWKQAPAVSRPLALTSAALGAAIGAPLIVDGARDFVGKLIEGRDPLGQALGTGEGIQGLAKLAGGLGIAATGFFGPRVVQQIRAGGPGAAAMRNVLFDFVRGPTTSTTPITGAWGKMHMASQTSSLALAAFAGVGAIANIQSAIEDRGAEGLVETKAGRTGLLLGVSAALLGGFHLLAAFRGRPAGMGRLAATIQSPWLMDGNVRTIRTAAQTLVGAGFVANEAGLLDRLNARD